MEKNNIIQEAVDYIEKNVQNEITPLDVADNAGYSLYHFSREFTRYVGMPLKMFMLNVRLSYAIYDISQGLSITDASFKYGFSTHAGFYKAFKRFNGCSPKKYIELRNINKPDYSRIRGEIDMKLEKALVKKIFYAYTNEEVSTCEVVKKGGGYVCDKAWNINNKYTLKVAQHRLSLEDMNKCLTRLGEKYCNIQMPVALANGDYIYMEDELYFGLYTKVDGEFLLPGERYSDRLSEYSNKYGIAIANLHFAMKALDGEEFINEQDFLRVVSDWALPTTRKILEQRNICYDEKVLRNYVSEFSELFVKLPKQSIHRNANPSNIFFENGEVTGFVDFELSEVNIRLFDPCYCATGILSEAKDVEDGYDKWAEILQGILAGYDSVATLSKEEKKAVPYVVYGIQMIFIAYLERVNHQEALMRNIDMLVWIMEHHHDCFKL